MIETLIVLLGFFCPAPDLPTDNEVTSVMRTDDPSKPILGSSPYNLPTTPSEDGTLAYRVVVDPLYVGYGPCFYRQVREVLNDARSWPNTREAAPKEAPQVWVILTAPGGGCIVERHDGHEHKPQAWTCAAGANGTGQIRLNAMQWFDHSSTYLHLDGWRTYLVNHEMGHMFGLKHEPCSIMGKVTHWRDGPRWDGGCDPMIWPTDEDRKAANTSLVANS